VLLPRLRGNLSRMKQLQPVIWAKGTFLSPQHLQSQDRYLEDTLLFRTNALSFRPYGFTQLRLDQQALSSGVLALAEASGIMPDGLCFDMPGSDPVPEARPLANCFEADQGTADIFLAIPQRRDHGINVSAKGVGADSRYRMEFQMLRDENSGQNEKPVQVARRNFRFVIGNENREGVSALQIGRILKTANNGVELDEHTPPTLLNIAASDYLTTMTRRLVELLNAKATDLAGMRRQRNQTLADFTAADIPNFWLLYTVNTFLPQFRHIFEGRKGHPEALYSAMLSLAGALTTFSTEIQVRDLPLYNHDSPGDCFTDLDVKLRRLLEATIPQNVVTLPLRAVQPTIYATALDDERYLANTRMYLAIASESNQAEVIGKTPQIVKICSANHIEHLIKNALPGIALQHSAVPPSAIPLKLNYEYFSLNQSGGAWESVLRSRNFAAHVPSDLRNPRLELVIILPQKS
jgi:type VI secretion system protein ImpJ